MTDLQLIITAVVHTVGARIDRIAPVSGDQSVRDRGAVSLEQVLWFVAAGVSVAVIAGIVWGQIRAQANAPIVTPSAP